MGTFSDAEGLVNGTDGTDGTDGGTEGKGGTADGKGGAADGNGGIADGNGGTTDGNGGCPGTCGARDDPESRFLFCGLDSGARGATGASFCGAEGAWPGCIGIFGADVGTMPLRLSFTLLSLGIPPAKISPNCGGPPEGKDGALGADTWPVGASGAEVRIDTFESIWGFDLSTVTAFLRFIPLRISPSKASLPAGIDDGGGGGRFRPAGGGGGGGGGPAIFCLKEKNGGWISWFRGVEVRDSRA